MSLHHRLWVTRVTVPGPIGPKTRQRGTGNPRCRLFPDRANPDRLGEPELWLPNTSGANRTLRPARVSISSSGSPFDRVSVLEGRKFREGKISSSLRGVSFFSDDEAISCTEGDSFSRMNFDVRCHLSGVG